VPAPVDGDAVPFLRTVVSALQLVCSLTEMIGEHIVKVGMLYPNRAGTKFDMTYYLNHHIPMVLRLLGSALKGVSVEHGISGEEIKCAVYSNWSSRFLTLYKRFKQASDRTRRKS